MKWQLELPRQQRRLLWGLLGIAGTLIVCYVGTLAVAMPEESGSFWRIKGLFDMGSEANIPVWYSSMLLAMAGAAAYWCGHLSPAGPHRTAWQITAGLLVLMSCDEVAMLHEAAKQFLWRAGINWMKPGWFLLLIFGPVVLMVLITLGTRLRGSLRHSPIATRLLVAGVIIFFGGAIGLEGPARSFKDAGYVWVAELIGITEESMEMLGSITILGGLLVHQGVLKSRHAIRRSATSA